MSTPAVASPRGSTTDLYLVLDDDDRIVGVSPRLRDELGHWLGHLLWDHVPAAREICEPSFDEARASGQPVESVVFYSGRVRRLTAVPAADGLAVYAERLAELDVTSLGTLMQSLARIEAALTARGYARPDSPARASLRALP